MGSEAFAEVSLADIADFRNGKAIPPEKYTPEGKHLVFGSNGQIARSDEVLCPDPTIVIGRVGAYCGCVHFVPTASWVTDNAIVASPQEGNDIRYLYYLLGSLGLERTAIGSAQPLMTQKGLKVVQTKVPPLPEQKAIAHILGTLDDKIELNRRMNATLEGMAQALFKSWFVDFDPVIDNALAAGNPIPDELAPRAEVRKKALADDGASTTQQGSLDHPTLSDPKSLFPAAFQFTEELGWIPEGWEVMQVKDFGSVVCGKTPSKSNADYYGDDVPFIKIPDMHRSAWITETSDGLSFAGANSQGKKQIPAKSISVSCIATVGKVVITSEASHTNQQINSVIPNAEHSRYYLYFSFLEKNKELHDLASGGSATLNLNTGVFSKIRLLSPPATALELYHEATNSLFKKMLANDRESKSLTKLRDTLLPNLISGTLQAETKP